jgi:hypothetical protein
VTRIALQKANPGVGDDAGAQEQATADGESYPTALVTRIVTSAPVYLLASSVGDEVWASHWRGFADLRLCGSKAVPAAPSIIRWSCTPASGYPSIGRSAKAVALGFAPPGRLLVDRSLASFPRSPSMAIGEGYKAQGSLHCCPDRLFHCRPFL